jgi:hypothetical protein
MSPSASPPWSRRRASVIEPRATTGILFFVQCRRLCRMFFFGHSTIDREKPNEIRIWPKKMQRYGYHERSPSRKKNFYKSLRVSGAFVTEPPNYDGPHIPVIVIMTSDSCTYVLHNLKGMLSSEQDPITGVL